MSWEQTFHDSPDLFDEEGLGSSHRPSDQETSLPASQPRENGPIACTNSQEPEQDLAQLLMADAAAEVALVHAPVVRQSDSVATSATPPLQGISMNGEGEPREPISGDVAPVVLTTQLNSEEEYHQHAADMQGGCITEYDALVEKVKNSTDPSEETKDDLLKLGVSCWMSASGEVAPSAEIPLRVAAATAEVREKFWDKWATCIYDVKAIYSATEVHQKPRNTSLRAFVHQTVESFYTTLLNGGEKRTPKDIQRDTPLAAVAPRAIAKACERLSIGFGLPPDGHAVAQVFHGQAAYYWHGADGSLKVPALIESESEWNVGNTRFPFIAEGDVSSGQ